MAFLSHAACNEDLFTLSKQATNTVGGTPLPGGSPNLGSAANFGVLASSTITNTGASAVTGDLGLYPGTSVTGFPPGTVSGTQHITDAAAQLAQTDAMSAYTAMQAIGGATDESGVDLGTLTLAAGTYKFTSSAQLTGTLHLSGSSSAVYVFQIGSTLTTAAASSINFGSVLPANVYWAVGSSATLGTTTSFGGTIIALASITANTGATNNGGLFALTDAVTLAGNTAASQNSQAVGGIQSVVLYTLPANGMRRPGASVRVTAWGTQGASNNSSVALRIGSTTMEATPYSSGLNAPWVLKAVLTAGKTTLLQQGYGEGYAFATVLTPTFTGPAAIDAGVSNVINVLTTAATAGSVKVNGFIVEGLSNEDVPTPGF